MLRFLLPQRRLGIRAYNFSGLEASELQERHAPRLLGAIVCQAMLDGMLKLELRVKDEAGIPYMRYFGPIDRPSPIWFDMFAPPRKCYPWLLCTCRRFSRAGDAFPSRGTIPARRFWKDLYLELEVPAPDHFQIAWPREHATDRRRVDPAGLRYPKMPYASEGTPS